MCYYCYEVDKSCSATRFQRLLAYSFQYLGVKQY
jgi:hypothetical protein